MAFKQGHALLVGVGTYAYAPAMNAPLTVRDAREIQEVLRDPNRAGYPAEQVTLLHDSGASRQTVLDALDDLAQRTTENDTLFLFYAGHGDFDNQGAYYLTTHDTRWENRKVVAGTGIREDELLAKLGAIKAARTFLIFNACHSGALTPSELRQLGADDESHGAPVPDETTAAMLGTGQGRVVITACRESQRSYFLASHPLTFFTEALSGALQGKGLESRHGYISVFDLYSALYDGVRAEIARRSNGSLVQEPELTILKGLGAMAIALYRGEEGLRDLGPADLPETLPDHVREVKEAESRAQLQQILSGTFQHSVVAGRDARQAGGDLVEGDQWNVEDSQGVIGEVSGGTVSQQFGDTVNTGGGPFIGGGVSMGDRSTFVGRDQNAGERVQGDKTEGDHISIGNITGSSGIAIGRAARAHVDIRQGADPQQVAALFQAVYERIGQSAHPPALQSVIQQQVKALEEEAGAGDSADPTVVENAFTVLKSIAPDILEVAAAALASPVAGLSRVVQKVAAHVRADR